MPKIPDTDDLELLDTTEGIEFYKDGENVVVSSESIRAGKTASKSPTIRL